MRLLVATNELQGSAPGDYSWTVEGELVLADVTECGSPDRCGCGRGFPGLASRRATTTAMVTDLPHIDRAMFVEMVRDHVDDHWAAVFRDALSPDDPDPDTTIAEQLDEVVGEYVESIEILCSEFPVGTVLERSGTLVAARSFPAAA